MGIIEFFVGWYVFGFIAMTLWDTLYHKTTMKKFRHNIRTILLFSFLGPILIFLFLGVKALSKL